MSKKRANRKRRAKHANTIRQIAKRREVETPAHTNIMGWEQDKAIIRYILILFLVSRSALTLIGYFAREFIGVVEHVGNVKRYGISSGYDWLDIWGAWDTRWYVTIAEHWYSPAADIAGYASYGFFPLYPALAKLFGYPFGSGYIGGVIVSNLALCLGAYLLYKLVEEIHTSQIAKRAVLFMFVFPVSFYFSAVLTEALFMMLSIGAYYFARKGNYLVAGALGGLSACARSVGLFIGLLLLWEYMKQKKYKIRNIGFDILLLGLVPLGTLLYLLVCYLVTGDFLAGLSIQEDAWNNAKREQPFWVIWHALFEGFPASEYKTYYLETMLVIGDWKGMPGAVFMALFTIFTLSVLFRGYKDIGFGLWCWALLLILFPLSHPSALLAMPRYISVVFPLFIILAMRKLGRWHYPLVAFFIVLQGILMAIWTNGFRFVI